MAKDKTSGAVFSIQDVRYPEEAPFENDLQGKSIDCNDLNRNPLQAATRHNALDVTLTSSSTGGAGLSDKPWRVDIAGFNMQLEDYRDSPLQWNAGLESNSVVTITETEHSLCAMSADKTSLVSGKDCRFTVPHSAATKVDTLRGRLLSQAGCTASRILRANH